MINEVIKIAREAGNAIMKIYLEPEFEVITKEDDSPLTKADLVSDQIIAKGLSHISPYPILSEENYIEFSERKNWNKFWLVDPLDGTKDFIDRNGEFTINIALIEQSKPVLGVLLAPAIGLLYHAEKGKGAFCNGNPIKNTSKRNDLVGSDSRHHSTKETIHFFEKHRIYQVIKFGSAVKFGKLAEGIIDIYPRLNGTKEWDTAAGQIICNEADCKLVDCVTGKEIVYNKENIKNNFFIASRNDLDLN
jgi:3'(2'), 5'-bisphosphate nucleotidase